MWVDGDTYLDPRDSGRKRGDRCGRWSRKKEWCSTQDFHRAFAFLWDFKLKPSRVS